MVPIVTMSSIRIPCRVLTSVIESIANNVDGVTCCADIRTRGTEHAVYLDMTVYVKPDMTIEKAHSIIDRIENLIKEKIPSVVDVIVHIEPDKKESNFKV